jgi:hypothetical protein
VEDSSFEEVKRWRKRIVNEILEMVQMGKGENTKAML